MKLIVEFEWDNELGQKWFNIDNLKLCLYSKDYWTQEKLLRIKEINNPPHP